MLVMFTCCLKTMTYLMASALSTGCSLTKTVTNVYTLGVSVKRYKTVLHTWLALSSITRDASESMYTLLTVC